ncbi:hypothetical protein DICVIV_04377 [Dictyocaulus viviparus]|uniref:G-protein coupled receptors family 1 profile domain-containing protein n=1 Tax=Dictyocaulus viviparus TaxID=29172 RepID=A0A0D8XXW1_DICVI|nr:hypothetical protein DICVIV_04377 [Dictyocaulus viviparus]
MLPFRIQNLRKKMNDDEVKQNSTINTDHLPVLPFLPPTEEPSSFAMTISVGLVGCLTVAICGNASQIVLQVPLGLPSMILEKLVRVWMFGQLSCNVHHILVIAERVIIPWGLAALHIFIAMLLTRPNQFTRIEGMLASLALVGLLALVLVIVIPQGMSAELKIIRKDEIDGELYIMLIHTYQCFISDDLYTSTKVLRIAFEFIAPLTISVYVHLQIRARSKLNCQSAITRNLIYILLIHYSCNILHYIPESKWANVTDVLPEEADMRQILPFFSPMLTWYPLGQLSVALSRYLSNKIEDDQPRSRKTGRLTTDTERSHIINNCVEC